MYIYNMTVIVYLDRRSEKEYLGRGLAILVVALVAGQPDNVWPPDVKGQLSRKDPEGRRRRG